MVQKLFQLFILVACVSLSVCAQQLTPKQYVEKYKDLAIREMKRMGVPAAVTLAQGLLETENGNSDLVKNLIIILALNVKVPGRLRQLLMMMMLLVNVLEVIKMPKHLTEIIVII